MPLCCQSGSGKFHRRVDGWDAIAATLFASGDGHLLPVFGFFVESLWVETNYGACSDDRSDGGHSQFGPFLDGQLHSFSFGECLKEVQSPWAFAVTALSLGERDDALSSSDLFQCGQILPTATIKKGDLLSWSHPQHLSDMTVGSRIELLGGVGPERRRAVDSGGGHGLVELEYQVKQIVSYLQKCRELVAFTDYNGWIDNSTIGYRTLDSGSDWAVVEVWFEEIFISACCEDRSERRGRLRLQFDGVGEVVASEVI